MFRLLPWPSSIGGNKVMEEVKMLAPNCALNSLSIPVKRKRSDSATDAPAPTKLCTESTRPISDSVPSQASIPPVASPPSAQVAVTAPSITRLRETISAQLSLEVLLKHNELRLIDQEIAKCQVALEQLRRCGEIPYPGSHVAGVSADVSSGTGASLLAPGNGPAVSPAPWGITEGPYARHYARWLLQDPRFDGEDSGMLAGTAPEGRSTRGNPGDLSMFAGKSRPQRGSTGAKHTALPSGYPLVKEKSGPMLIRRKSDGVLVKLVCLDCRRDNFSSTQGFINHCRIAHNRNFASHDAAAMACGQSVQVDDSGVVVGGSAEPTANPTTPGYVHPLIRSNLATPSKALPTPTKDFVTPSKPIAANTSAVATPPATDPKCRQSALVRMPPNPSFLASPATPHLSALMKSRGAGLDMSKLVEEFQQPVDLGALSDDDSDSDDSRPAETLDLGARAGRQPMRMPVGQAESESRKALDRAHGPMQQATPSRPQSFLDISLAGQAQSMESRSDLDHANLSPHAIESNQAPSLVSDDEDDYEAASDSDSPPSSEADDQEQEFRHIQVEDDERAAAPTTTEAKPGPSLASPAPNPGPPVQPLKRSRSKKISSMTFDEDRVGYVHPDQAKRAAERKP
jgi:ADA HAT complex component 1